jgi:NAD(P)-dependent dehydrogenase (short-subunit alcohol dehydrogenase family)
LTAQLCNPKEMYSVPDQTGRRFIVTGANSGTGKESTKRLAAAGATVVMGVRSLEKGEAARDEILAAHSSARLELRRIDLADLASVREFAQGIIDAGEPVHALVNNAGVMAPPKRMTTADGFELQFGTNFLGPFALTNLLLPVLLATPDARVATMSSGVADFGRIRFGDLQSSRRYSAWPAYAQSKLADMLMGRQLAKVANGRRWSLLSTVAHPGYTRTNLQTSGANLGRDKPVRRQPGDRTLLPSQAVEQGAEPLLYAATWPDAQQGAYYGPRGVFGLVGPTKKTRFPRSARSSEVAARLWAQAEDLTGTHLPA